MDRPKILISAGEASGDLYASELVKALRVQHPFVEFFGVAGPRMQAAGVRPVVDAASLAVVGLVEVVTHIPRIFGEFRKLVRAAKAERPRLAILTDSPDFNLRVATKLHEMDIPVVYLVAPQVWAWRSGRVKRMRRDLQRVLCIFPFEEPWFRERGLSADYIGHPLTRVVRSSLSKEEFFRKHQLDPGRPLVALLGGSRVGEVRRHLPVLNEAGQLLREQVSAQNVLALPPHFSERVSSSFFRERIDAKAIKVIEGETWDVLAHASVAIAASGTVTIEAAILGTPMVTYYKVTGVSWAIGRWLVRVPFYSMVNLVAGRPIVPELMQNDATGESLAAAAVRLLRDDSARKAMQRELAAVRAKLVTAEQPMDRAAQIIGRYLD